MSASLLKAQNLVSTRVILKVNALTKIGLIDSTRLKLILVFYKKNERIFEKVANLSFRPRFAHCKYHIYCVSAPKTKVSQYQQAIIVLSWTEWNAKLTLYIFRINGIGSRAQRAQREALEASFPEWIRSFPGGQR